MKQKQGSLLVQALLNISIFGVFSLFAIQSIQVLGKPIGINHLKREYVQLQLDYLAALHHGAHVNEDHVCFSRSICLVINNQRLILTPGYQILLEDIIEFHIIDHQTTIQLKLKKMNQWISYDIKK